MKIHWYQSNGVVGVAWIGPFHFVVNQWHEKDDYRVEVGGNNFVASFSHDADRADITRFMVKYTKLKLQGWIKEFEEWENDNVHA